MWDGWGEEAPTQDAAQSQITATSLTDLEIANSLIPCIADDKKKGGVCGKNDSKSNSKKSSKNGKEEGAGAGKGTGSACKPVSSRAQQQQKRKEIKALKFDREKAKRLETIMIKAQKLQLYEEEKKLRIQNEQEKKVIEDKLIQEKETNKIGTEEKVTDNGVMSCASTDINATLISVAIAPVIKETFKMMKIEEKKTEAVQLNHSIAKVTPGTVEVDVAVVKEIEMSDGHASPEYGDSDGIEEDDEEDDIDPDPEVEVGAKNVLTPSTQEDDDDALIKRRSMGQGFLRDIMAEYNRDSNSNLLSSEGARDSSLHTSKSTPAPLPLSSTVIATIGAADLGSDPRLSELLGALAASQQSCTKLWSPKKVSENAYTKVSVRIIQKMQ